MTGHQQTFDAKLLNLGSGAEHDDPSVKRSANLKGLRLANQMECTRRRDGFLCLTLLR